MSVRRAISFVLAVLAVLAQPAMGFDRVIHYDLVYAIAIANGFSPVDAALIARGSQSLDDNQSTTAFEWPLVGKEMKDVGMGNGSLEELPHMKSGQVFHALTKNRDLIEKLHIERIERALADPGISRERRLLYLGEYLHFVGDEVVHPTDPLLGHFTEGHFPDRSDLSPGSLLVVTGVLNDKLQAYRQDEASGGESHALTPTTAEQFTRIPGQLSADPNADRLLHKVVQTVVDSWTRTYPNERCGGISACNELLTTADVYRDFNEQAREARAASEIARDLNNAGYEYHVYRKDKAIQLDSNGEPTVSGPGNEQFGAAPASAEGFAATLAAEADLKKERQDVALVQLFRASDLAAEELARDFGVPLSQDAITEQRKAAAWIPPSSPGGIALNPDLELPLADLGHPVRLEREGNSLFLVTSKGRFRFDGVSARSFATLARTIAAGQIPYLSIGSEPSDRPGFARVTYAPALQGTVEGLALYRADLQFKTIFAKLPLTDEARAQGLEALLAGYPGQGGDFSRFWITSRNIRLALDGDRLITADPGMRINCETRLHFAVRPDPEMEAYVEGLTRHWSEIAKVVPEFQEVQTLALTTAVVFWARDHRVPTDPAILLDPPEASLTPDYAPIVGVFENDLEIAGGVSLTPEDRDTELGRVFLSAIAYRLSQSDTRHSAWFARVLLAAEGLVIVALALVLPAFLLRWFAARIPKPFSFRRAFVAWSVLCAAQIAVIALLHSLILGTTMSFFDRDLLALLATIGLFPVLLFVMLRRWLNRPLLTSWRRRAMLALGLCGPLIAGLAGAGLAQITVAVSGPVPSTGLHLLLSVEVSPLEAVGRAFFTRSIKPGETTGTFFPAPQSLMETFRPEFTLYSLGGKAQDVIQLKDNNPNLPVDTLQRIHWPKNQTPPPGLKHYTVDGRPPF